jgi:cell wall-associated NlpC family hydrolase
MTFCRAEHLAASKTAAKDQPMIRICLLATLVMSTTAYAAEKTSSATAEPPKSGDMRRFAERIEPTLAGKPERLDQYVHFFSRELANDSRICAFNVKATQEGKQVALTGFVEFPETRTALVEYLQALGFNVDDRLEKLPTAGLGKKIYGLVKAPHSYSFDRPTGQRKQENDCLLAEPLLLLREQDDHLLAHSGEGYLGYIPSDDVVRLDEAAYLKYLEGPRVLITAKQTVSDQPLIPAGARLKWISTEGETVTAEMPTGDHVKLPAAACKTLKTPATDIDDIITTGQKLIGTRYFWGGRTAEGIDCSGLVQMSYASAGLHLPRDAYQQFYIGQITATRWHPGGMRRGDTLYFLGSDGKIRHTAIYLGNDKFLQAVMPQVRISSFNPNDPEYDAPRHKSFAFAKRLLD